jgi:hypothetical protein
MYLSTRHEHDHFPLQWTFGGEGIVPVCVNCHDLKDRVSLMNWPVIASGAAFEEVLEAVVPSGEIEWRSSAGWTEQEYPYWLLVHLRWVAVKEAWTSLSPIARVLIAKILVIDQLGRHHAWRTWAAADHGAEFGHKDGKGIEDDIR